MVARRGDVSAVAASDPGAFHWRSAGGLALHAVDYPASSGSGRLPMLCLHGLTRNARDFAAVAPWIAAQGRRVLAIDVRGRGGSAWDPAANYRLPAYADDVCRLMDAAGLPHAIFVGTSMGGLITMELAGVRPALIAGAVVNDVGPVLAPAGLQRIGGYVGKIGPFADWQAAADAIAHNNCAAFPGYGAADWMEMARRMCREADGGIVADYDPAIVKPFADTPRSDDPWQRWRALADGTRPVLLLRGALSDLLDDAVAAEMACAPRVTLREVPEVGHAPTLDEAAAREALAAFLADAP